MRLNISTLLLQDQEKTISVSLKILTQPESFIASENEKIKVFKSSNGMEIISYDYPSLTKNAIWVRGKNRSKDNTLAVKQFSCYKEAIEFQTKVLQTIKEFNQIYDGK